MGTCCPSSKLGRSLVCSDHLSAPLWYRCLILTSLASFHSTQLSDMFGFPCFTGSRSFILLPNSSIDGEVPSPAMGVFLYCSIACRIFSQFGLPSDLVFSCKVLFAVSALMFPWGL